MERDGRSDPATRQFRQQLNEWFESHGVLDNLRSHLRSLMVTALQQTDISLKPNQKTTPKTQSVNLLVAEYLLRHGCHYTLSVLASELPALANFAPSASVLRRGTRQIRGSHHFQDGEVVEILNSLGLATRDENLRPVTEAYARNREEESLLECLLGLVSKIQLQSPGWDGSGGECSLLSKEWRDAVSDVLATAQTNPAEARKTLAKMTEKEVMRTAEEERRKQVRDLVERERRIQEFLRCHEDEVLRRLERAERQLDDRRETIDRELKERQMHLGRIACQWKERHAEVVDMAKNLSALKSENKSLQERLSVLEKEMNEMRAELKRKTETIDKLEAEKTSFKCHVQEYLRWKRTRATDADLRGHCSDVCEERQRGDNPRKEESSDSSSTNPADELLLSKAKTRLRQLEEESTRLSESYLRYRQKYDESEDFNGVVLPTVKDDAVPEVVVVPVHLKDENRVKEACERGCGTEEDDEPGIVDSPVAVEIAATGSQPPEKEDLRVPAPTKRQLANREYYLKSRSLLEVLEKSAGIMEEYLSDASSSSSSVAVSSSRREDPLTAAPELTDVECLNLLKEAKVAGEKPEVSRLIL